MSPTEGFAFWTICRCITATGLLLAASLAFLDFTCALLYERRMPERSLLPTHAPLVLFQAP